MMWKLRKTIAALGNFKALCLPTYYRIGKNEKTSHWRMFYIEWDMPMITIVDSNDFDKDAAEQILDDIILEIVVRWFQVEHL